MGNTDRAHHPLCLPDRPGVEHDNECECRCHDLGSDGTNE